MGVEGPSPRDEEEREAEEGDQSEEGDEALEKGRRVAEERVEGGREAAKVIDSGSSDAEDDLGTQDVLDEGE